MVIRNKQRRYTSINPALFLTQALRSLEEAKGLEATGDQHQIGSALRVYTTLIQTFQNVFTLKGPAGQDRIKPLNDRHLILQIVNIAQDAKQGFDRTHEALPIQTAINIRAQFYPAPSYPADVSYAQTWLRSIASALPEAPVETEKDTSKGKGKAPSPQQENAPVLPPVYADETRAPSEECLVCGDNFKDVTRPSRPPTATCQHPAEICRSCISQTVAAHVEVRGVAQAVPCPHSNCDGTLSREDVKAFATDEVFARWDMLSLRDIMSKNKDDGLFIWCQNPSCYSGQLHPEGDAQPIVTCVRCSERTCFVHNCVYHEGQTCKQYDRSRPVKDALNRAVSRAAIWWRTRNCPGCFQPIQKNGGCRHMHCRCGYYFTWWYAPIHYRRIIPFIKARSPGI